MVGFMAGKIPRPQGVCPPRPGGTAVPLSRWSSGVWGTSKVPQRSLGTFRRWKVPRRRLLRNRPRRRTGTRFAYLGRRFPRPLPKRAWLFPEPTVSTPHSLFVPPKRERAVDGTREKGGFGGLRSPVPPRETGECPADRPAHQTTLFPEHCRVSERTGYKTFRAVICFM